ncbi:endonuclease V [Streptomyces albidus (ex Kaewkla and Franco 2022)]|uniref:endonuclease V n=1 Tax=Streptomyces albidus (ex Kaewkla and Franco 2022) TaxID=722709 RepID=UPI0015EECADA|nr:endonuclease V [Streptomyces albidus (ex Kaewkla and Franco 2022)]
MNTPAGSATWPRDEAEALAVQDALREGVEESDHSPRPGAPGSLIAGLDVAYDDARDVVAAAVVALDGESLRVVAEATALGRVAFPYVPGLLAFREIPALLDALAELEGRLGRAPDLLVCDGYGRAHPRRFGLASHLGVLTGVPSMGVAKNPFVFTHAEVGPLRGDAAALVDGGEEVGRALRTREGVKPVYVSAGHRVGLEEACAHTLSLAPRYRLPETTRLADALCRGALRATRPAGRP